MAAATRVLKFDTVYGSEIRRTHDFSRFHLNGILNHEQMYIHAYIYIYIFNIHICKVHLCHNLYSCNMSEASSLGMVDFARSLYGHFAGRSRTRLCSGMAVMHCRRAEASILEPPR